MQQTPNRRQKLTLELNIQLAKNNLVRKVIPQGPRSMLRAISDSLYYHTNYVQQLIHLCKTQLQIGLQNHTLPPKLNHLYTNSSMVTDYKQNPDLSGFAKVHLQLISQAYEKKIIIFYLSEDYYLNSLIINSKNYVKVIMLSRIQNFYTPVVDKQIYEMANMIKQLFYDKLLFESTKLTTKKQDKLNSRKIHKKSLSACDQLQYKQIFNTPIKPTFQYRKPPVLKKVQSFQQEMEDLSLIIQCNTVNRKKSGLIQDPLDLFQKYKYEYAKFQNSDYRIHSQKVLSLQALSQNGTPINKSKAKVFQKQDTNKRSTGRLKFFDQNKNYGFIVIDEDLSDIFVHYDDLYKAGMTKQYMRTTKQGNIIRFEFSCMVYVGKYDKSRKAVDLILIEQEEYLI